MFERGYDSLMRKGHEVISEGMIWQRQKMGCDCCFPLEGRSLKLL